MMLTVVKGPLCYNNIKKVDGVQHKTFRKACFAMGFLQDDREFIEAIKEAHVWGSGLFLRKLFVTMLLSSSMNRPAHVWRKSWKYLSDGILYEQRLVARNQEHTYSYYAYSYRGVLVFVGAILPYLSVTMLHYFLLSLYPIYIRNALKYGWKAGSFCLSEQIREHAIYLTLTDEELQQLTLMAIETLLQNNNKTLKDYKPMPYPKDYVVSFSGNRLIYDERQYDPIAQQQLLARLYGSLTDGQRSIYEEIMEAVEKQRGGVFFLYGYGGTGLHHVLAGFAMAIERKNRGRRRLLQPVASSGIASLLLPGGRTTHSRFKIPVPTLDSSICNINKKDDIAGLLKVTDLIIWDEAPMANKYCFEALDKSLKDIMSGTTHGQDKIFGGKVVVFGGDFRQILPVVPRGTRSDIIYATINSSYLWDHCKFLKLTKNMRLQSGAATSTTEDIRAFSEWILQIGDGTLCEPSDGYADICIPDEFLIANFSDPIKAISRAILASTIEVVDDINQYITALIPGEEKEYYSSDSIDKSDANNFDGYEHVTPEFLHALKTSGLPNHSIKLKVGATIMLMRNLDQSEGLCNGTRLTVTRLANHVIEAKIISGKNVGNIIYIPRMSLSPSQSPWPFKLVRRQFPIIVSFAMTINKSQGQSLDHVRLYLPKEVFSHGQLYVVISRVKSKKGLRILIHDKDKEALTITTNVVFKEVFQNIN
ncbi:uncharacterized protein LOC131638334 [Vicia villosa]|uniref:uncharacterized protein LOC131638334 n=1 Tax=Vicia villosa TaxID=3911 RepID=UPI00273BF996|nr:uncharacterized protein LOC131638334 [Vicia villosa]